VTSDRTPESIIRSKRDGEELSAEAIRSFIQGFLSDDVADYQMSAFLMAVTLQGMSERETTDLTRAMAESGERLDVPRSPSGKWTSIRRGEWGTSSLCPWFLWSPRAGWRCR
jgi:thymidine phosphorylase